MQGTVPEGVLPVDYCALSAQLFLHCSNLSSDTQLLAELSMRVCAGSAVEEKGTLEGEAMVPPTTLVAVEGFCCRPG